MAREFTHRQVAVKVNVTCDEGIVPLVVALNEINGLRTHDSCQCTPDGQASVFFEYGDDWRNLAEMMQSLSSRLGEERISCGFVFRLEWWGSNEWPRAEILMNPRHVATVADAIKKIAPEINRRTFA